MSYQAKAILAVSTLLLVLLVHEMSWQDAMRAEYIRNHGVMSK